MRWIPLDEVISECMKHPGFEEEYIKAGIELEAQLAAERMHVERTETGRPRTALARPTAKRKPRVFSTKRQRATA